MKPPLRIGMLAYPDTQILDVVGPLEVFGRTTRWLRDHGRSGAGAYAIEIIGLTRGAFRTSSGLRLLAARGFREVWRGLDTLLIAGGIGVTACLSRRTFQRLLGAPPSRYRERFSRHRMSGT